MQLPHARMWNFSYIFGKRDTLCLYEAFIAFHRLNIQATILLYAPALLHLEYRYRQTDILLTEKKSKYRLICHRNVRDICTCLYKIVNLLKSYNNVHVMTYTSKIMLTG